MSDASIHELAAGYTLDALDEPDRSAFEAHLADCDECRETVAMLADGATALAYAAEGPAPPVRDALDGCRCGGGVSRDRARALGDARRLGWLAGSRAADDRAQRRKRQ